jgi:transketolase
MRDDFISVITDNITKDNDSIFFSANMSWGTFKELENSINSIDKCMKEGRFLDIGIREATMIAMASGLAINGKKVYCQSIANFPSIRVLEQIRNLVCYPNLDIKMISVGAGFAYGKEGMTHQMTEDMNILSSIPNIEIFTPCDKYEAMAVAKIFNEHKTPQFVRLVKSTEDVYNRELNDKQLAKLKNGEPILVFDNKVDSDKTNVIFSTGSIIQEAIQAAKAINDKNVKVFSCPRLPLVTNIELENEVNSKINKIISIEEGYKINGLGYALNNSLNEKVEVIGLGSYVDFVGNENDIREHYGLTAKAIIDVLSI